MTVEMPTEASPVTVVCGDARDVLRSLPDGCVDAVVTDPPYPQEFWPSVRDLAKECGRVLRDRGELICLVGQHMMPHALCWFRDAGLRYWWVCGMRQHARMPMLGKRVNVYFKPALWFVKGKKRKLHDMPSDLVLGNKPDKVHHVWEQGTSWFRHWCDRICNPGELILDPFAGSGTTGVAAVAEGRRAILVEREPEYADVCRRRVAEAMGMGAGSLLKATVPDLFSGVGDGG